MARETWDDMPEAPASGSEHYFRMKDLKDTKPGNFAVVRILSPFLRYSLGWKNKKPVRYAEGEAIPDVQWDNDMNGNPQAPRFAVATAVWDYAKGVVKVWEITQVSIYREIKELASDAAWGIPLEYDLR
ncbi:MAG: hypothetical protein AAB426_09415, partial [Myxococcota bacterium]